VGSGEGNRGGTGGVGRCLDFQFLTTEFGLAKNAKTKVEKVFFFILMSSYAEVSFGAKKRENVSK
jgi:hypothetical protein